MKNKVKATLFICSFLLVNVVKSHPDNFYIEIKKDGLEIGQYEGKQFKKKQLKSYAFQKENIAEIKELLFGNEPENMLYYFHCLYGGVRLFHKNSLKRLNQFNQSNKIISIVWHAEKMAYKKNWHQSIEQSESIRNLLLQLWQTDRKSNRILCHSMGHRIFEGVVQSFDSQDVKFESIIFAAGDLDVTVFEGNLKILPNISQTIVIYIHQKDRLLKASSKKHGRKRLGLHGLKEDELLGEFANVAVIDVTNSSGKRWISTTNHSYFKQDDRVLADIMALLENDLEKRVGWLEKGEGNRWEMN